MLKVIDYYKSYGDKEVVKGINLEVKPGEIFNAKVTRLMTFGAFAEILPGQEGLIHISEFSDQRIAKIEDVAKVGDIIPVRVKQIDDQGRINLSAKNVRPKTE